MEQFSSYVKAREIIIEELQKLQASVWGRTETHELLSVRFSKYSKYLNLPAVLSSVVFSSGTFISNTENYLMTIILGCLGVLTTILVTLATHFDFSGLSDSHKHTSFAYRRFDRRIENLYMKLTVKDIPEINEKNTPQQILDDLLENWYNIGSEFNSILENAPSLHTNLTTKDGFLSFNYEPLIISKRSSANEYMNEKISKIQDEIIPTVNNAIPIQNDLSHGSLTISNMLPKEPKHIVQQTLNQINEL
jgi:hypothetical protein